MNIVSWLHRTPKMERAARQASTHALRSDSCIRQVEWGLWSNCRLEATCVSFNAVPLNLSHAFPDGESMSTNRPTWETQLRALKLHTQAEGARGNDSHVIHMPARPQLEPGLWSYRQNNPTWVCLVGSCDPGNGWGYKRGRDQASIGLMFPTWGHIWECTSEGENTTETADGCTNKDR